MTLNLDFLNAIFVAIFKSSIYSFMYLVDVIGHNQDYFTYTTTAHPLLSALSNNYCLTDKCYLFICLNKSRTVISKAVSFMVANPALVEKANALW